MCPMDRGDQMLAIGGLDLIIGPREGELSLNCCFELDWLTRHKRHGTFDVTYNK